MAEIDEKPIEKICRIFQIRGEYRSCEVLTLGHINTTYKVYFYRDGEIKDYILQRVNTYVFKDPVRVMEMIWGVHLPVEYVIRLQLMAGVYRFSRYFLQMNVFMIANTVSTDALMMLKE